MGNFYRIPADKRDLNYEKYFTNGNQERIKLAEFNSNNTKLLTVEQTKEKLMSLQYVSDELQKWRNRR
ncbi:UDP-glucose 4-epimerase [bioreactor metagenome]|uniref:UDP-glucose 4-epimerase n=1 Tax=bioreactor metagenome TaxID=1076179 RepID=A0A644ZNR2_9ZZZZ